MEGLRLEHVDGFRSLWVDGFLGIRSGQRIVVTHLIGAAVYGLGGGLWSVPIAFAGGLAFDRTINQQAMADAYASHSERLLALRLLQQQRLMNEDGPWVS